MASNPEQPPPGQDGLWHWNGAGWTLFLLDAPITIVGPDGQSLTITWDQLRRLLAVSTGIDGLQERGSLR